jgi:predicted site-specific integrase-resolvase
MIENKDNTKVLFLTTEEVLRILRVSKRTLQNYRSEGKLLYYKMNNKTIRYKTSEVISFLNRSSCSSYQKDAYKKFIPNL